MCYPLLQQLHEEFCALFEDIMADFLKKEGYGIQEFYEEVRQAQEKILKDEESNEVVDVIFMVSLFFPIN